jgi:hypothetical protein
MQKWNPYPNICVLLNLSLIVVAMFLSINVIFKAATCRTYEYMKHRYGFFISIWKTFNILLEKTGKKIHQLTNIYSRPSCVQFSVPRFFTPYCWRISSHRYMHFYPVYVVFSFLLTRYKADNS